MEYAAHTRENSRDEQSLHDHLNQTAALAAGFAAPFQAEEQAFLCGMLHDIGKYSDKFQQRIHGKEIRVEHSAAGVHVCGEKFKNTPAAFCIGGHHGGLPDMGGRSDTADSGTLIGKLKRTPEDYSAYQTEIALPPALAHHALELPAAEGYFYTKMLYSCLVDADFLDTEAFVSGKVDRSMGELTPEYLEKLNARIEPWLLETEGLNGKRTAILKALMKNAGGEPGLYSLTVPTGGGKTMASMAFALHHAKSNGMRRIIYVIPYTSIIEQTQDVFEGCFGKGSVLAHYANVAYEHEENGERKDRAYLASENWDAPVILTTAVQFFESIFANKSSHCRKLHNIAGSVLIFDEAQMLPPVYLRACVYAIAQLVKHYGCTAVLCTATQPSLDRLFEEMLPGRTIGELCPKPLSEDPIFERVVFSLEGKLSDEELAARLRGEQSVLCIVNSRKKAQALYAMLEGEGTYHLSTTMIATHRRDVLREIRARLREKKECRVISTSLVEAGVDLDFVAVYRSMAGLDSILQAAGRCNRSGNAAAKDSVVHVFEEEEKPPESLRQNIEAAKKTMGRGGDLASPETVRQYFNVLYYILKDDNGLDPKKIMEDVLGNRPKFESIASRFHLIENTQCTVYIPRGEGEALAEEWEAKGMSRGLMRRLGQYAVGIYPADFIAMEAAGKLKRISENAGFLTDRSLYDETVGLKLSEAGQSGLALFE